MLLKIAWRNIWRNRKRSLIIIVAVFLGLWAGIFLIAFNNGMIEQRIRTAIAQEISHLQMHHPQFSTDYDPKFSIPDGSDILMREATDLNIKALSGRVIVMGMISSAYGSSGVAINGIVPGEENKLTNLESKISSGNYFDPVKSNQIILSERLAKKLKLKQGHKTILTFQDKDGEIASASFKITALYKTVNSPYDERNVFVKNNDIDQLIGLPGAFHEIALLLNSNSFLDSTQYQLKRKYPGLKIENWMEISPELGLTVSVSDQMVYIYMGIILLALAFGIINTMMMSVLERTRELGMLMALGMNKIRIFGMIMLETFFLVIAGCPVGISLGIITVYFTHKHGIDFSAYEEVYANFGYSSTIYPVLSLEHLLLILELVVMATLISGLFPARRALKLKPVETIRK